MAHEPLSFVQASDLLIDRPITGLTQAPDALLEALYESPRLAAERVFDAALTEEADALLLAGDVVDLSIASPRDLVFLTEQFDRLAARDIPVFWAGGAADPPEAWPKSTPLPENVTFFPAGRLTQHVLKRGDKPVATVVGASRKPGDAPPVFSKPSHAPLSVGVLYAPEEQRASASDEVNYLALGGRSRRSTIERPVGLAHYAGTPQGRSPADQGPSGCTVVRLDESGVAKTRFVATDSIRWGEETLEFTAGVNAAQLEQRLRERLDKVIARSKGVDQLISWRLHGVGPLVAELHAEGLCRSLLDELQSRTGGQRPLVWSYSLECPDAYEPPHEQLDQETILGDLLRQVEVLRRNEAFGLDLKELLPRPIADASLNETATIHTTDRDDLYNRAAKLGVALMTDESA